MDDQDLLVRELGKLPVGVLLARKMKATIAINRLKSLRIGVVGLIGISTSQFFKSFFSSTDMTLIDLLPAVLCMINVVLYMHVDNKESLQIANKDLITDLLQHKDNLE